MNNDSYNFQPTGPAPDAQPAYQPVNPQPAYQPAGGYPNQMSQQPAPQGGRVSGALVALTVLFALGTVIFVVLFIWMAAQYTDVSATLDSRVSAAVATAVDENTEKLQTEFAEKEKNPLKKFAGPADYGELTFNYPKTWSVYEYESATNGGNFSAVFNPDKITSTSGNVVNALRLQISNTSYENAISSYQGRVTNGELEMQIIQINGANANLYIGQLGDGFYGAITIIKIRDKTVTLQTDSWAVFQNDFVNLLNSISYNA